MLESDHVLLCEHGREPDECSTCGGHEPEHGVYDPFVWITRYRALVREPAEVPEELLGVPLN